MIRARPPKPWHRWAARLRQGFGGRAKIPRPRMYIKIYFDDKPLFLTDSIDAELEPFLHHDDAVFIDEFSSPAINSMVYEMQLPRIHAGIFKHENLKTLQKAFWKKFNLIQAGGGAVWNQNDALLFIHRRGKWDLPKGKLDPGESIETCAVREVEEETGIRSTIRRHLLNTYHTYHENGKFMLKETFWYEMKAADTESSKPQTEEDITAIEWLAKTDWQKIESNTFPSIKDVLAALGS